MKTSLSRTALGWLALPALTLLLAGNASADAGQATGQSSPTAPKSAAAHEMSADEHAAMSADDHGMNAAEHAAMAADDHGMTAAEHAAMSADDASSERDPAPAKTTESHAGHEAAPAEATEAAPAKAAESHDGHDATSTQAAGDRPVGLILGGFGAVNGLVLVAATVLRRRPAAQKRLKTLARVRATAGTRTVPAAKPSETKA
jgi:hypothetical protein